MADRIFNLFNFRDLGGYRLKNGGTTKCGAIARSNILLHATEEDFAKLKALGFTTIVDLRTEMELEKHVHQLSNHPDFTYIHAKCDNWWRDPFYGVEESAMYYMMLVLLYDNIRGVLTAIADAKSGVVFNCHAGKDRTGITAALCLMIAGAEDRDIIDDYAKTYDSYWGDTPKEEFFYLELQPGVSKEQKIADAGLIELGKITNTPCIIFDDRRRTQEGGRSNHRNRQGSRNCPRRYR